MTTVQNIEVGKPQPALKATLSEWEALESKLVPLNMIQTMPELQPRDAGLIRKEVERLEQERRLVNSTEDFQAALKADPNYHTRDAVLILRTQDGLFITDGHHRLEAYREARRPVIPAKVMTTDIATAMTVAGMANTRGSTVALHRDEVIEAVWRTVTQVFHYGERSAETVSSQGGYSYRGIAGLFNQQVSPDTVMRMVKAVEWLKKEQAVSADEWPDWRECCALRRSGKGELPEEDDLIEIEAVAREIGLVIQSKNLPVANAACRMALQLKVEAISLGQKRGLCVVDDDDIY